MEFVGQSSWKDNQTEEKGLVRGETWIEKGSSGSPKHSLAMSDDGKWFGDYSTTQRRGRKGAQEENSFKETSRNLTHQLELGASNFH